MKKLTLLVTALILFTYGCTNEDIPLSEELQQKDSIIEFSGKNEANNGVIHHVSAGGNDACEAWGDEPGCDRSYSLTAKMMADGSVKGQFIDGWGGDNPHAGMHADITCMFVDGNMAKIGGVITKGQFSDGYDLTGAYFFAVLKDNGTSNNDTPDEIGFSWLYTFDVCEYAEFFSYENANLALTRGQVTIW